MDNKEIKKRMKELCWGKLSGCCTLERDCDYRSRVLRKLGIKREEYEKLNKEFDDKINKLIERRKND